MADHTLSACHATVERPDRYSTPLLFDLWTGPSPAPLPLNRLFLW
jgi:hypothetical protein